MFRSFRLWFGLLARCFRSHHTLLLENLALRQQLNVLKRKHRRPWMGGVDKIFWVFARRFWGAWKQSLVLVTPETVVRWHRAGFRTYWSLIFRVKKQVGRKPISIAVTGRKASPPIPGKLDKGIEKALRRLQSCGIETWESCEGGPGHAYPEPTVSFYGTPEAGWRAVGVCLAYGLPIMSLRRVWNILDSNEPTSLGNYFSTKGLANLDALFAARFVSGSIFTMSREDFLSIRAIIMIMVDVAMFWRIFE
jgi:hypothetical protein